MDSNEFSEAEINQILTLIKEKKQIHEIAQTMGIKYFPQRELYKNTNFNERNYGVSVELNFLSKLKEQQYLDSQHLYFYCNLMKNVYKQKKIAAASCYFFADFISGTTDTIDDFFNQPQQQPIKLDFTNLGKNLQPQQQNTQDNTTSKLENTQQQQVINQSIQNTSVQQQSQVIEQEKIIDIETKQQNQLTDTNNEQQNKLLTPVENTHQDLIQSRQYDPTISQINLQQGKMEIEPAVDQIKNEQNLKSIIQQNQPEIHQKGQIIQQKHIEPITKQVKQQAANQQNQSSQIKVNNQKQNDDNRLIQSELISQSNYTQNQEKLLSQTVSAKKDTNSSVSQTQNNPQTQKQKGDQKQPFQPQGDHTKDQSNILVSFGQNNKEHITQAQQQPNIEKQQNLEQSRFSQQSGTHSQITASPQLNFEIQSQESGHISNQQNSQIKNQDTEQRLNENKIISGPSSQNESHIQYEQNPQLQLSSQKPSAPVSNQNDFSKWNFQITNVAVVQQPLFQSQTFAQNRQQKKPQIQKRKLEGLLQELAQNNDLSNYLELQQFDYLYFPINQQQSHWISIVVDIKQMIIHYFDSYYPKVEEYMIDGINTILEKLNIETKKFKIQNHFVRQENGYDCGIFALLSLLYTYQNQQYDYDQFKVNTYRARKLHNLAVLGSQKNLFKELFEYIVD